MKKAFWVVFLTMTMTMCANTMAAAILQKQTTGTSGNLCHYSDGSVVNVKYLSCPSFSSPENSGSNSSNNSQITNELIMREQLRLGQAANDMMTGGIRSMRQGDQSLIPELLRLQKEHPDSGRVLHSDAFLKWISEEKVRQKAHKNATNKKKPNLHALEILLVTFKGWPWISNPEFISHAKQSSLLRILLERANGGDITATKELIREAKAFATNNKNISKSVPTPTPTPTPTPDSNLYKGGFGEVLTHSQSDTHLEQSYAVRVADCILKDKADYMSLDWYHENHLRLFTEKFYEIEQIRDKLVFQAPTQKREKELLKKIGHSKTNALRFLTHAQETGKERHQELLLNLLACNGE
jgi:hypothetical protein